MQGGREGILNLGSVNVVIHKSIDGNDPDMLCKEARNKIASVLTHAWKMYCKLMRAINFCYMNIEPLIPWNELKR